MTNEEAIKHITTWIYAAPGLPPMQVVQALELAVSALRAGGKDMNSPTMPGGQPLTLEQLQEVPHGKIKDRTLKSICDRANEIAYPPARIDREAWTGCTCNTKSKSCCTCVSLRCQFCIGESEYKRGKYCSACGRPLTEEAWAELEKRVRGITG